MGSRHSLARIRPERIAEKTREATSNGKRSAVKLTPPSPEATLDTWLDWVELATTRKDRSARLRHLAKWCDSREPRFQTTQSLLAQKSFQLFGLELLARQRAPIPVGLIVPVSTLLREPTLRSGLKLAVAGQLIASAPSDVSRVETVIAHLAHGVGPKRKLERLLRLQSVVAPAGHLDTVVEKLLQTTGYVCPECQKCLPRMRFVSHLWNTHRIVFHARKFLRPSDRTNAIVESASEITPEVVEQFYHVAKDSFPTVQPYQVQSGLMRYTGTSRNELGPICEQAGKIGAGICPGCLTAIISPHVPLPPPLLLAHGVLMGERYCLSIDDGHQTRKVTITRPGGNPEPQIDPEAKLSEQHFGVRVSTILLAVGLLGSLLLPRDVVHPLLYAVMLTILALVAYGVARFIRKPGPNREQRLINTAWRDVAPDAGRSLVAVQFLTRLGLASFGRGDREARFKLLREFVEDAATLADKGRRYEQWFAVMQALRTYDTAEQGRDWVSLLVGLYEPFFQGELRTTYAEQLSAVLLTIPEFTPRDAARLRVLLLSSAFSANLNPASLVALTTASPLLARILPGRLRSFALFWEIWKKRNTKSWETEVGEAVSIFDFAKKSPVKSGKILAEYPDTLLVWEPESAVAKDVGTILIGAEGVTVGSVTITDPDATIEMRTTKNATHVLLLGRTTVPLSKKPSEKFVRQLQGWLRYRTDALFAATDRAKEMPLTPKLFELLSHLESHCPVCGKHSILRIAEVGVLLPEPNG